MTKQQQLDRLAQEILDKNTTPELAATATQLVMGEVNLDADVVFIGEAPGANEDKLGRPFVGAAGKFLDEMLHSIGFQRSDVYITNIVKYRPPGNRDPLPEEIAAFKPFLFRQLAIIQPQLVVFLGRHSMSVFLPQLKISQVHGRAFRRAGQVYMPLYHPAAALYNGGMRAELLDDFAGIPQVLAQLKQ
ncbi:MAG TPA: uracil-DNA glycosylase [Candidatus Polarisedimenticolaceae bacterium]|nr:uracil-DNA glycosylase [Candidatus Polarisedimenticolaceae bacterium]